MGFDVGVFGVILIMFIINASRFLEHTHKRFLNNLKLCSFEIEFQEHHVHV